MLTRLHSWALNTTDSLTDHLTAADITNWIATHNGPLADPTANVVGWLRVPQTDPMFTTAADPSTGPTSAHYEFIFTVRPSREHVSCLADIATERVRRQHADSAVVWQLLHHQHQPGRADLARHAQSRIHQPADAAPDQPELPHHGAGPCACLHTLRAACDSDGARRRS
jgi:hypothetical protein